MPFCPSCEAEYQAGVSSCPTCNTSLVDRLEDTGSREDMVDVYACYDQQLAQRLVELLHDSGLKPFLRDQSSTTFPTNVGTTGERRIAVPSAVAREAIAALQDALDDGVITREDGDILSAA
jgi:hypothetical protein